MSESGRGPGAVGRTLYEPPSHGSGASDSEAHSVKSDTSVGENDDVKDVPLNPRQRSPKEVIQGFKNVYETPSVTDRLTNLIRTFFKSKFLEVPASSRVFEDSVIYSYLDVSTDSQNLAVQRVLYKLIVELDTLARVGFYSALAREPQKGGRRMNFELFHDSTGRGCQVQPDDRPRRGYQTAGILLAIRGDANILCQRDIDALQMFSPKSQESLVLPTVVVDVRCPSLVDVYKHRVWRPLMRTPRNSLPPFGRGQTSVVRYSLSKSAEPHVNLWVRVLETSEAFDHLKNQVDQMEIDKHDKNLPSSK